MIQNDLNLKKENVSPWEGHAGYLELPKYVCYQNDQEVWGISQDNPITFPMFETDCIVWFSK